MMLKNKSQNKYITHETRRIERIVTALDLLTTNEKTDTLHVIDMLEKLLERWVECDTRWDDIIDGINNLPGTEEEKKIFVLGYLTRVFLTEIK